jgi:hypothetical protein
MTQHLREALARDRLVALDEHLAGCAACRREREALAAFVTRLQKVDPVSLPPLARPSGHGWHASSMRTRSRRPLLVGASSAAVLAVTVLMVALTGPRDGARDARDGVVPEHQVAVRPSLADRRSPRTRMAEQDALSQPSIQNRCTVPSAPRMDDLAYLNENVSPVADRSRLPSARRSPPPDNHRQQAAGEGDDFVFVPQPRIAAAAGADGPLPADKAAADAVASFQRERAVVDTRLVRKASVAVKGTALSDLCEQLHTETGIALTAGRSVADEKVTLFCKAMPLRDVMRRLSRPFGYTWLRSGKEPEYRYELVQDLRSQLLEEELREQDRKAALLALNQQLEQYRQYLDLSPEEARRRAANASPEEKKLLERYAGSGWGPTQIYFRLSPQEMAALRAGQTVVFNSEPGPGEQPLPPALGRGVLQSHRDWRLYRRDGQFAISTDPREHPAGSLPPSEVPEARGKVRLQMDQSDLGQLALSGGSGVTGIYPGGGHTMHDDWIAVGESPSVQSPRNAVSNAGLARDPALQRRVAVRPQPSYRPPVAAVTGEESGSERPNEQRDRARQPMVTTADVLEALHRATGMPIVADYYTRLYPAATLTLPEQGLFTALNKLSDTMRLRWSKADGWLQFRSTSFFHDRLKEVPNRLLSRWAEARRRAGALGLEEVCEVAQLTDSQLDAQSMAEGARLLYGLAEWDLARRSSLRRYLRHLVQFTPAQRQQAQRPEGLPFGQMTLAQQQGFLSLALPRDAAAGQVPLEELTGATMRLDYRVPGRFEWSVAPPDPRREPRIELAPPPVYEPTREAALAAARRIEPSVTPEAIRPTELQLAILYLPSPKSRLHAGGVRAMRHGTLNMPMTVAGP